jgi:NAD(P)-dependent dehydrogenase (short-subunit alcohol dehydrogenase family)
MSKGVVIQMSRAMALDHAHDKIRVNAVCPSSTCGEGRLKLLEASENGMGHLAI